MRYTKAALPSPQLIARWQAKGLAIADIAAAERALTFVGYFRLRGYALALMQPSPTGRIFVAGATFDNILACYELDRDLRRIVLGQLERIEVAVRTVKFAVFVESALAYFDFVEEQSSDGTGSKQFAEYPTERQVWRSIIREIDGESDAYQMSLGQFLQEWALANKTPEAPSNSVRCLTIHSSKGMEFLHDYLVGMAEDQLPSFQSKKTGDDSREMQEERRNCFVAITRTIETLTLTYAQRYNGWRKEPSRFLYEMGLLTQQESS